MARKNLLKGFKKPKGITFEHLETNPNYGKFTAHPFEPGFGTTIGNNCVIGAGCVISGKVEDNTILKFSAKYQKLKITEK